MTDGLELVLLWVGGIILLLSFIGFILAVREFYIMMKCDVVIGADQLSAFGLCFPIINVFSLLFAIIYIIYKNSKERRIANHLRINRM